MFKSDPYSQPHYTHLPSHPPPPQGEGEMSKAPPLAHPTWAGVVKGQPLPVASPGPFPLAARLLQLYRDCVARGTWARLCFETIGEEELSFLCRVGGAATSTAATGASKKQGRPANKRRRERARRRRKAWVERRRGPAVEGAAAAWSSNHRSSSCQQEQQSLTG